jgi:predicted flap endonuclease-1-like 5' DNA nuclease
MNTPVAFVLGLLVGWLVEWLIDYFYWRRRCAEREAALLAEYRSNAGVPAGRAATVEPDFQSHRDDLKIIKGIGPVIEARLNQAGIYTFQQLGELTTDDLERILGDMIERLADEGSILEQARTLARRG